MSDYFAKIYVDIAEATAASRDALTNAMEPLGDAEDYLNTGKAGNVKTIVDVQTQSSGGGNFTETSISEIAFEVANLVPANSTWTQMQDLSNANTPYNAIVTSLNNFVINNVLGAETSKTGSGGAYQSTLQDFLDIDCADYWDTDPSAGAGAPKSWIELMQSNGFDVVDTYPDGN